MPVDAKPALTTESGPTQSSVVPIIGDPLDQVLNRFSPEIQASILKTIARAGFPAVEIMSADLHWLYLNEIAEQNFGYTNDELQGQHIEILAPDLRFRRVLDISGLMGAVSRNLPWEGHFVRKIRYERHLAFHARVIPIVDAAGERVALLKLSRDFERADEDQNELEARLGESDVLRKHAYEDRLTSLPNRRALAAYLSGEMFRSSMTDESGWYLSVAVNDFDRLRDRFARTVSDECLVEIAHRVRKSFAANAHVARVDENAFGLYIQDCNEDALAEQVQQLDKLPCGPIRTTGGVDVKLRFTFAAVPLLARYKNAEQLFDVSKRTIGVARSVNGNFAIADEALDEELSVAITTIRAMKRSLRSGGGEFTFRPVAFRSLALRSVYLCASTVRRSDGSTLQAPEYAERLELTGHLSAFTRARVNRIVELIHMVRRRNDRVRATLYLPVALAEVRGDTLWAALDACYEAGQLRRGELGLLLDGVPCVHDSQQCAQRLVNLRGAGLSLAVRLDPQIEGALRTLRTLRPDMLVLRHETAEEAGAQQIVRTVVAHLTRCARDLNCLTVAEARERCVTFVDMCYDFGCEGVVSLREFDAFREFDFVQFEGNTRGDVV